MGKPRIIAETGAGQHGVATRHRRRPVRPAVPGLHGRGRRAPAEAQRLQDAGPGHRGRAASRSGSRTLRDAINEAMRDWMATRRAHALHHRQRRRAAPVPADRPRFPVGHRPARRGSNAWSRSAGCPTSSSPASAAAATRPACSIPFVGRRRGGTGRRRGRRPRRQRRASMPPRSSHGQPGVLHGTFSYVLQDDDGQTAAVHSVSAGLDYPGVGPEHSYWKDSRPRALHQRRRRRGAGRLRPLLAAGRHPAGPGDGPCRGRGDAHRGRGGRRTMWWWSASPAAATRTASRWPGCRARNE